MTRSTSCSSTPAPPVGLDTHTPKEIRVEMSDTSADAGFKQIAGVTLATMKDDQLFPADGNVLGRFVKITIVSNNGGPITDESKPTLDLVAGILKQHADWKLTIEGYTGPDVNAASKRSGARQPRSGAT
jgi:hypothetical protein